MTLREVAGDLWRRRWLRGVVVVAAALLVVVATALERTSGPQGGASVRAPDLHPWSLLGCFAVRLGSWTASSRAPASAGDAPADSESVSAGRPGEAASGAADGGASGLSPAAEELLSSVAPPSEVMLLPDSVDRWGRILPSYRAAVLPGTRERDRSLRWFVRADTLWFLWSERGVRAGMALLQTGDGMRGRARALGGADSLDASAAATAWRINCATLAPERIPERERR